MPGTAERRRRNTDTGRADLVGTEALLQQLIRSPIMTVDQAGDILLGAIYQPANLRSPATDPELTHREAVSHVDMVKEAIARSRSMGAVPYNHLRRAYQLPPVESFEEVSSDPQIVLLLRQAYSDDIELLDAFVGGAAEDASSGSLYGPTMSMVLCGTFQRLRQHDPLFYEANGMFTAQESLRLHAVTLAGMLRANLPILNRVSLRRVLKLPQAVHHKDRANQDCIVSDWQPASECSRVCDGGRRLDTRKVIQEAKGHGLPCPPLRRAVACNLQPCRYQDMVSMEENRVCVVGYWASYGDCIDGVRQQLRPILRPPPAGADDCPTLHRTIPCSGGPSQGGVVVVINRTQGEEGGLEPTEEPPMEYDDCVMSDWSYFTPCSQSCGLGIHSRTRTIMSTPFEGAKCPPTEHVVECNAGPCTGSNDEDDSTTAPTAIVEGGHCRDTPLVHGTHQETCKGLQKDQTCTVFVAIINQHCLLRCLPSGRHSEPMCADDPADLAVFEANTAPQAAVGGGASGGNGGVIAGAAVGVLLVIALALVGYRYSTRTPLENELVGREPSSVSLGVPPTAKLKRKHSDLNALQHPQPIEEDQELGSVFSDLSPVTEQDVHERTGYTRRASTKWLENSGLTTDASSDV
eukprot:TRINITY_DN9364_c0_g1_i2.p1 TRINITY_DN9364_c0_g1~~TRINITY_DN9364_c0_g1_i2.p1  ORF type:complete len:686 (+),score=158.65 TRINITY_DN9364_c0_g1_i2:157-2058(+)